jgi:hypothetical protein
MPERRQEFEAEVPTAPALIESPSCAAAADQSSSLAYIPSQRARQGDAEVVLELRNTEDGQVAVLAYSSLELLVAGCGEAQPWVAIPVDRVEHLPGLAGADVVLWNLALPAELRSADEEAS